MKAILVLEDGTVFKGNSFGASGEALGEIVFNTSMAGYQEIITDPSYKGQLVMMTYPLIGNYGVNREDGESRCPFLEGFVVKEYSKIASNWRKKQELGEYLKENNILAIEGVDTRALTLNIREKGALKAIISTINFDQSVLAHKARISPGLVGVDLVQAVTVSKKYIYSPYPVKGAGFKVAVLDCGVKYNILRELLRYQCKIIVMPAQASAKEILAVRADGVLLSNGPGDPAAVGYVVKTVAELIGRIPIFGICLGHQMLGLALGGRTYKLKFGHHGANHPVKDLRTGKVYITSQNHGFCVDIDSLPKKDIQLTHINLNDGTLEGLRHRKLPVFSVQFHPEAAPGPHEAEYLFGEFVELMRKFKKLKR